MGNLGKEREFDVIEITPEILKQLQAVQLELLTEADRICRKHDIDYSLDGGTLLGAVRHKGFIPWDDDIDIIMSRKDYERFFEVCEKELESERFFLQEHRTDPACHVGYPRLKRNNTVYSRAGHERLNYRQGVFIDIFVLDNVPDNYVLRRLHRAVCFVNRKLLWANGGRYIAKNAVLRFWYRILALVPAVWVFRCNDALARSCGKKPTELVRHNTHPYPNPKVCGYGIPAELISGYIPLEFEGKSFMAVKQFDRYLTMLYGDYMTLPPLNKRVPSIRLSAFKPVKE